jgi:hypothetical protein
MSSNSVQETVPGSHAHPAATLRHRSAAAPPGGEEATQQQPHSHSQIHTLVGLLGNAYPEQPELFGAWILQGVRNVLQGC